MKRPLAVFATLAAIGAGALIATPANAQFYVGADPGGVGVQVGPFGLGVGPGYWGGPYGYGYGAPYAYSEPYAYAGECRVVRERIVTPSGHRAYRTQEVCD
jgi:hypothetical protein